MRAPQKEKKTSNDQEPYVYSWVICALSIWVHTTQGRFMGKGRVHLQSGRGQDVSVTVFCNTYLINTHSYGNEQWDRHWWGLISDYTRNSILLVLPPWTLRGEVVIIHLLGVDIHPEVVDVSALARLWSTSNKVTTPKLSLMLIDIHQGLSYQLFPNHSCHCYIFSVCIYLRNQQSISTSLNSGALPVNCTSVALVFYAK